MPNELNKVGLYVAANPLTSDDYYFEVEIIDTGLIAAIGKKPFTQLIFIGLDQIMVSSSQWPSG